MTSPAPVRPTSRITADGIRARLPTVDRRFTDSPQFECPPLSSALGCALTLKVETNNPIRCFKGRGASALIAEHAADPSGSRHVVTASAGNWGQAVALAAAEHGLGCTVFAATSANPAKLERMRALGAEIVSWGADVDAAKAAGRVHAAKRDQRFLEDGLDVATAEGHGSMGMELVAAAEADGRPFDAVVVPIGNGSMIAGVGTWFRAASPDTDVVGVTAVGAPAMRLAFVDPDGPPGPEVIDTIADGLAIRVPIPEAVRDVNGVTDAVVEVDDAHLVAAMELLLHEAGLVTEPSGAAGVAAVLAHPDRFAGRRVATIICGSNVAPGVLPERLAPA